MAQHIATIIGLSLAALAAAHVTLYVVGPRRSSPTDPCDAPRRRLPARVIFAEVVSSLWLLATILRPAGFPVRPRNVPVRSILVLAPPWLPARALGAFARRLARHGALVDVMRVPFRARPAVLARLAARAERIGRSVGTGASLVFFDRAGQLSKGLADTLAPYGGDSILLGPRDVTTTDLPTGSTIIHAADDAWTVPIHPGIRNGMIMLDGLGHLSLLMAPHVADVVTDALANP